MAVKGLCEEDTLRLLGGDKRREQNLRRLVQDGTGARAIRVHGESAFALQELYARVLEKDSAVVEALNVPPKLLKPGEAQHREARVLVGRVCL